MKESDVGNGTDRTRRARMISARALELLDRPQHARQSWSREQAEELMKLAEAQVAVELKKEADRG